MSKFVKIGLGLAVVVTIILSAVGTTTLHKNYIYARTSKSVVKLTVPQGGGGTGFQLSYKGETYVVSNAHVCDAAGKDGFMTGRRDMEPTQHKLKILIKDYRVDLCLLSPMADGVALEIGAAPKQHQEVMVVGHPRLRPLSIAMGKILDLTEVTIPFRVETKAQCDSRGGEFKRIQVFIFVADLCFVTHMAYWSDALVEPGNSGSPVVNFWGDVVAVAFAAGSDISFFIPASSLKGLLDKFQSGKDSQEAYYNPKRPGNKFGKTLYEDNMFLDVAYL